MDLKGVLIWLKNHFDTPLTTVLLHPQNFLFQKQIVLIEENTTQGCIMPPHMINS